MPLREDRGARPAPPKAHAPLRAVEFFSGIGGFAAAVADAGLPVRIAAAFDQDRDASRVYAQWHGACPSLRTLQSIPAEAIPPADLWWWSPPCQPFSRRGRQRDLDDPRAAPFCHLTGLLDHHRPRWLVVENVLGFGSSRARQLLLGELHRLSYRLRETILCPTAFGIPMQRPRWFLAAGRDDPGPIPAPPPPVRRPALSEFLDARAHSDPALLLPPALAARHAAVWNIADPSDQAARAICFTAHYGKCLKSGGSLLPGPQGSLRRFSPGEILRLLGFPPTLEFPEDLPLRTAWKLAGNSLDLHCLRHLLLHVLRGALPADQAGP